MSLWISTNGEITCITHAGTYLSTAAQADPNACTHSTPLSTWDRLGEPGAAFLRSALGRETLCEVCHTLS